MWVIMTHLYQIIVQLEVHGRARREAARRRKSEWKVNLDSRNSSHSNGRSNEKLQWKYLPYPEVMDSNTLKFSQILSFHDYFFCGGTPSPFGCALAGLGQSVARVKIWGAAPLRPRKKSAEKSPLGCKCIKVNNFFVWGPKCNNFFSFNVGGVVDLHELFQFSICWSVQEIFVIKVESCQKSRKILDDFLNVKNFGGWAL